MLKFVLSLKSRGGLGGLRCRLMSPEGLFYSCVRHVGELRLGMRLEGWWSNGNTAPAIQSLWAIAFIGRSGLSNRCRGRGLNWTWSWEMPASEGQRVVPVQLLYGGILEGGARVLVPMSVLVHVKLRLSSLD